MADAGPLLYFTKNVPVPFPTSHGPGGCADTGHWVRSELDPVECLKKLEGRQISFHLKDITEAGKVDAPDVPWGQGKGNVEGILREVYRQKAKPFFGIEYEQHGETRPDLAKCLAFIDQVAAKVAA